MDQNNITLLAQLALQISDQLDHDFPAQKQIVVSLGQSPAYLLKMIELIDKNKRQNREYVYLAFSGNCYTENDRIDSQLLSNYKEKKHHYLSYLRKLNISPETLRNDHEAKLIVLEVAHSGAGLKSFLQVFGHPQKINVLYLQNNCFKRPVLSCHDLYRLETNKQEEKLLVQLANADRFKDRLVPHYAVHEWGDIDPLTWQPQENSTLIINELKRWIEKSVIQ